ncbi:unnamed protein product [Owenia fusiformis]|uniref:Uncharacterized protein n=1 Tax=Owenia fusiformis TaxID=6347 RepID=A0A8J1V128_OWEFU|nr:unnamed protein product [Owenia fusiformis]
MLKTIDLMLGFNSNDGFAIVWWWAYLHRPKGSPRVPLAWNDTVLFLPVLHDLIRDYIQENSLESIASVIHDVFSYTYLGLNKGNEKDNENIAAITHDFITDYWYRIATIEFSQLHTALGGSPFLYQLTQKKANDNEDITWLKGAKHGDDLDYIFPDVDSFLNRPKEEQRLSYNMIMYWTNFAKTGDPNKPSADPALPTVWPIFTAENGEYLDLSNNITPVDGITKADRVRLWTEFLPKVIASAECGVRKIKRKLNRKEKKSDDI